MTQHARAWLSIWRIPHALEIYLLSPQGVLVIFNLHFYYYYFLERKKLALGNYYCHHAAVIISSSNPVGSEFLPNDLAAVLKKLKKREISRQPQNYIATFSTRYYHLLTCIYAVLARDKDQILKLRILALFLKRN